MAIEHLTDEEFKRFEPSIDIDYHSCPRDECTHLGYSGPGWYVLFGVGHKFHIERSPLGPFEDEAQAYAASGPYLF